MYYLTIKTGVVKHVSSERYHTVKTVSCWVPGDPNSTFLVTNFTKKCQKVQIPQIPPFNVRNIKYNFT